MGEGSTANLEGEPSALYFEYAATLPGLRKVTEVSSGRASAVQRRDAAAGKIG
jgi:hypothetical protein